MAHKAQISCPLVIGGNEILKSTFTGVSPFYPDYTYRVADASLLDLAAAIGSARRAERASWESRSACLEKAASLFTYQDADLEHAVRMTGTPITQVKALFEDIPRWLREVPRLHKARYPESSGDPLHPAETLAPGLARMLPPVEGFCYAVTPGNDPRSSALAAANLACLGIPFILKASPKDALAPLLIRALVQAGFDPNFCSLVYFDNQDPAQAQSKQFKLVEAGQCVWTFGPDQAVDAALRFESRGQRAVIDLQGMDPDRLDPGTLQTALSRQGFRVEDERYDHFEGKLVLRHNSGNCAAVAQGTIGETEKNLLYEATAFPLGCNATRTLLLVGSQAGAVDDLAGFLAGLVVGDPLDPGVQVGYVQPQNLDYIQALRDRLRLRISAYGGERLSPHQAAPLLISTQEDLPDLFAQEIPAYILATSTLSSVDEAVDHINRYTRREPRLAVSFLNLPQAALPKAFARVKAHAVLVNRPTTHVLPTLHEGNDYAARLTQNRLLIY